MPARVNLSELSPDVRRAVEKRTGRALRARKRSMTKDQVRTAAIRVLAVIAELAPAERARVLNHAHKMNGV